MEIGDRENTFPHLWDFRGDAAFASPEIYDCLEAKGFLHPRLHRDNGSDGRSQAQHRLSAGPNAGSRGEFRL